jgi:hypothetical protein
MGSDTELGARQVENILGRIAHGGITLAATIECCGGSMLALRLTAKGPTATVDAGPDLASVLAIRRSVNPSPCWNISSTP